MSIETYLILFGLGFVLTFVSWVSESFAERFERHHSKLIGLGVGGVVSVLFLSMIPEISQSLLGLPFALLGFSIFHLLHAYTYRSIPKRKRKLPLAQLEVLSFILAYFLSGALIAQAYFESPLHALALLFPLAVHKAAMGVLYFHATERAKIPRWQHQFVTISSLLGVVLAILLYDHRLTFQAFSGLTVGAFIYVVVRNLLPAKGGGRVDYFAAGVLLTALLEYLAGAL